MNSVRLHAAGPWPNLVERLVPELADATCKAITRQMVKLTVPDLKAQYPTLKLEAADRLFAQPRRSNDSAS